MFVPKQGTDPAEVSEPSESGDDFVFPDWSAYSDLTEAARAYFRDPELALSALERALEGREVLGFTLERMVSDDGAVWQEATVCDGDRLVLWHSEDVNDPDLPDGAMTSAVRAIPLSRVQEIAYRELLVPDSAGAAQVHGVDVYIMLEAIDEVSGVDTTGDDEGVSNTFMVRHDAVRLNKSLEAGGAGQIRRLTEFARLIARRTGVSMDGTK